ncbi:MAG: alpha/beta hydrolase, partial [Terracidiphilus sp.]
MKSNVLFKLALTGVIAATMAPLACAQASVAGDWQGTLSVSGTQLRLGLHIAAAKDGSLTATFDSIDQGAMGIPVTAITLKDSKLTFTVDAAHIAYEGAVNKDATEIDGTFTQGQDIPLNFKRAAAVAAPKPAAPSQIDGTWLGTLDTGAIKLRIVLKIVNTTDGLTVQLQSPDQSPNWMPATSATRNENTLTVTFKGIGVVYEGKIGADFNSIDGTFTQMGNPLPLNLKRAATQDAPQVTERSDIDGTWLGNLDTGAIKLRIVLKVLNTAESLNIQIQSPDQSSTWMPASSVTRKENTLTVSLSKLGAVYEAKIAADGSSIDGTFTQMGNPLPLNFKRIKNQAELEPPRPQTPVKPYPYREEEVAYPNKAGGNTLAGSITIPSGKGPFPAVLLITGSGPNDRDESHLGHKPFLVLSDYLTRKGIVVLRADKRGIGGSTGDLIAATTADFATDAEAGVANLKTHPEVDSRKIGLIGHSEGGIVAPMVAAADHDVAFVVMLAGSGVPGDQVVVEQTRLISEAAGESKEKADADAQKEAETLAVVKDEKDPATRERLLSVKLAAEGVPEAQLGAEIKQLNSPWFRFFINYDPATALRKLTIPVLVLSGSLDLQVPPAQNLPPIRKALAEAGNQHAEVDELPGLNHLFQDAKTGSPAEYGQIEETISPVALDKI